MRECELVYPLPLVAVPSVYFPPSFVVVEGGLSLEVPSVELCPSARLLVPTALVVRIDASRGESNSRLPSLRSISYVPGRIRKGTETELGDSVE